MDQSSEVQQSINEAHELLSRGKAQVEKLEAEDLKDQQLSMLSQSTKGPPSFDTVAR